MVVCKSGGPKAGQQRCSGWLIVRVGSCEVSHDNKASALNMKNGWKIEEK